MNTSKRILGLDIIRSLAILCVLFSHTGRNLVQHELWPKVTYSLGVIGVELFFVLSGFLIGQILIDSFTQHETWSSQQAKTFWVRRWLRTLPNYYLVLIIYFFVFVVMQDGFILKNWTTYFPYLFFMQNFISPHPSFFIMAWSLSIEEWFYLAFPFMLLLLQESFPKKHKNRIILSSIMVFIVGCTLFRILLAWNSDFTWDDVFRKFVVLRMDSIVVGVLAAYLYKRYTSLWEKHKTYFFLAGILLLLFLSYTFYADYLIQKEASFFIKTFFFNLLSLAIALLLPVFSSPRVALPGFLARMITYTSLISYSMYLNQELVIHFVYEFHTAFPLPDLALFLMNWGAVFMVSTLQYYVVERPILKKRDKITSPVVNT